VPHFIEKPPRNLLKVEKNKKEELIFIKEGFSSTTWKQSDRKNKAEPLIGLLWKNFIMMKKQGFIVNRKLVEKILEKEKKSS